MEKMKQITDKKQKTTDSWMPKTIMFALILIVFSGCKTIKTISKPQQNSASAISQVIEQIQKVQPQYSTVNASKLALELQLDGRTVNVSATCKIKKDSIIKIVYTH